MSHAKHRTASSRQQLRLFLCTNFVYVWLVFGWSVTLYPLGVDFQYLAQPSGLPSATQAVWETMMRLFGDNLALYRVFNILLLFWCMVCILLLTRLVLNGPWWLGSFAAVMTMANPAKSEAVLQLSAVADLFPAFCGLATLTVFAAWRRFAGNGLFVSSLLLCVFTVFHFAENLMLPIVMALLVPLVRSPKEKDIGRVVFVPLAILFVVGWLRQGWVFRDFDLNPVDMFAPLYLAFYPIGLRPFTVWLYANLPLWPIVILVVLLALFVWRVYRVSGQAAVLWGVVAAFVYRATPLSSMKTMDLSLGDMAMPVYFSGFDFVHSQGAGRMIVPFALLYIAMAAVWMQVQRHPRWRKQAVMLTTFLCLFFMALQFNALWHWREAAAMVKQFQARAALSVEESGGQEVAIAPELRRYHTAPVMLWASISYDTPFSKALPNRIALAMDAFPPGKGDVTILEWGPMAAEFEVTGATFMELFVPNLGLPLKGTEVLHYDGFSMKWRHENDKILLTVFPDGEFLPERVVPFRNRGEGLALSPDAP